METVFSKEVCAGLERARASTRARKSRFRVVADGATHRVLRMWKTGFAMADAAPCLLGFVDLYDGITHLFQCLIVTGSDSAGERLFEFKRATAIADRPALDFEMPDHKPIGQIGFARP